MSGDDLRTAAERGNLPEAKRILERNPNLINDAVRAAGCPCPARPPAHGAVGPSRGRSAEARPAPLRALPRLGGSGGITGGAPHSPLAPLWRWRDAAAAVAAAGRWGR